MIVVCVGNVIVMLIGIVRLWWRRDCGFVVFVRRRIVLRRGSMG